jgi:hypothetical protein
MYSNTYLRVALFECEHLLLRRGQYLLVLRLWYSYALMDRNKNALDDLFKAGSYPLVLEKQVEIIISQPRIEWIPHSAKAIIISRVATANKYALDFFNDAHVAGSC